jgi:UDP-N-acetylmuramoyl-tripeptide--D-alanyl-D-alanine ligase
MPRLDEFLAAVPHTALHSAGETSGIVFTGVSTDSRSIPQGALFIALRGSRFDGHRFIAEAGSCGASAAVISELDDEARASGIPLVLVDDTLSALQTWASHWRRNWHGRVVAVVGSNGKTTVTQMIGAIAARALGREMTWVTRGNLNNHIGVPLSVLGLRTEHQLAVFELGMNHPGEIAGLAAIASPQIVLITNAQREHQEFMKSVMAVAMENAQAFAALDQDGVAIFPRDPEHEHLWRQLAGTHRMVRFGLVHDPAGEGHGAGEVIGQRCPSAPEQMAITLASGERIDVDLRGAGEHYARNAVAAAAAAEVAGIPAASIAAAISEFSPLAGRGLQMPLPGGGLLVDDSYNANPDSVRAATAALAALRAPRALVLGDMGEVGAQEAECHQEVLQAAGAAGIESVWLHGAAMGRASRVSGVGRHFDDINELIARLGEWVLATQSAGSRPSLWIKGSRFMRMERVVTALAPPNREVAPCC